MLEIDELSVSYRSGKKMIHALGPINLKVAPGDIYALIGPSGCGKSTFLHVLSDIIKDYTGQVTLNGESLNSKKHDIGFIPQNFGLLPWKNVQKNCLLSLRIKKQRIDASLTERIDYIMNKLNIHSLKDRYPRELSGGQKQRVAIARAFIMNPDLLLMDEPFSALDALTREEAQELFIDIWNQYRTTTIFVTHSIEEAIYMGKKIAILSHCPGTVVEVIDNPLFNTENLRENEEYLKLSTHLRNVVKKGWQI
ncbi:NitT/TauT family transport system ATP-binding protein [Geosporobacter subterraneus DSM 17957]|uniref:NitT/TauT family transport system ATP-binding protein n=1 Tax=Geosporobacter subterraneus DSM 17957 TaxID=1121919 RepID=A0A1M6HZD3_9FIRM|nr:ABC transporter ATP-binding protein [Geosporobacter subterraneus]SHJ27454.1 NitT/TauT family transport system ATP-binding protein [Geosporobacter subterraneus DSM 17957]